MGRLHYYKYYLASLCSAYKLCIYVLRNVVLVYPPRFTAAQVLQTYALSLDYLSADTHPIVPRQAEVVLHAIEREGG